MTCLNSNPTVLQSSYVILNNLLKLPQFFHFKLGENNSTGRIVRTKCANKSKGFRVSTYLSAQPAFKLAEEKGRSSVGRSQLAAFPGMPEITIVTATYFRKKYGARRGSIPGVHISALTQGLWRGLSPALSIPGRCFPGCRGSSRRATRFCSRVAVRSQVFRLGRRAATVQPWTSPSSWRKTST